MSEPIVLEDLYIPFQARKKQSIVQLNTLECETANGR